MPRNVRFFCPQAAPQLSFSNGIPQCQRDDQPEVIDTSTVADLAGGLMLTGNSMVELDEQSR